MNPEVVTSAGLISVSEEGGETNVSMLPLFTTKGFAFWYQHNARSFLLTLSEMAVGSDYRACDVSDTS